MYVCVTESTNYMLMSYDMGIVSPSLLRVPLWIPEPPWSSVSRFFSWKY